jgi:hypothetical protein
MDDKGGSVIRVHVGKVTRGQGEDLGLLFPFECFNVRHLPHGAATRHLKCIFPIRQPLTANRYYLFYHTHHRRMGERVPAGVEQFRVGFAIGDDEAVAGDVAFAGLD